MAISVLSYGGGVQSTAMLVLAAQGHLDCTHALFANVGDDSEHPATLDYVRQVAVPFGQAHGVEVVELHRTKRTGERETLMGRLTRDGSRSVPIPVRMANGAPGTRSCTMDHKVMVIRRWAKAHGATKTDPAQVAIGISWDEIERMRNDAEEGIERRHYPLIDRRLTRTDCKRIIEDARLPVPPKSSCYFCPFHRPRAWADMRRDEPLLFWKSAALETLLNERRTVLGKHPVWLTRFNRPLADAIQETQPDLFQDRGNERCDEGYCWT